MSHVELQPGFDFQQAGKEVWRLNVNARRSLINTSIRISRLPVKRCSGVKGKLSSWGWENRGILGEKWRQRLPAPVHLHFRPSGEAAHGDLGMVTPQDVVIAISNSGESSEITALIPVLKRLHVPLICITGRPESSMARAADVHLCVKVAKEACPLGLAPTSSTTATLVMGDALAVALLKARGFTAEDFALSHQAAHWVVNSAARKRYYAYGR